MTGVTDGPTLSVWHYATVLGASEGELRLKILQEHRALVVRDAVSVVWPVGVEKPQVHRLAGSTGRSALGGAAWGALLGGVLLVPVAGVAVGTAAALIRRKLSTHIDPAFAADLRHRLTPGTSALVVLADEVDLDRAREVFPHPDGTLLWTDLDAETEQVLREATGPGAR